MWEEQVRAGLKAAGGMNLRSLLRTRRLAGDAEWITTEIDVDRDRSPAPQRIQAVRFGPDSGLRLLAVHGGEQSASHALTLSRMAADAGRWAPGKLAGHRIIGAVNGGYFLFLERLTAGRRFWKKHSRVGDPLGLMVSDGRLVSWPLFHRSALCQLEDGTVLVRRFGMEDVSFLLNGASIRVAVNEPDPNRVVCLCPDYSIPCSPRDRNRIDSVWINGKEAARKHGGGSPIPINGCVLSVPRSMATSGELNIEILPPHAHGKMIIDAVTSGPILVLDGEPIAITEDYLHSQGFTPDLPPFPSFNSVLKHYCIPAPRLAAGVDAHGGVAFVLIEGRMPGVSVGVDLSQTARIARAFGLISALNLDGGASAEIILNGSPINTPQLGDPKPMLNKMLGLLCRWSTPGTLPLPSELGDGTERPIGNALVWLVPE